MMTLGPLQWAATHGNDPVNDPIYGADAATHAQTTIANLVRTGGSTYQLANFDPATGAPAVPEILPDWGPFRDVESTLVARSRRGELYGFVQAYQATGNPAFLATAEEIAGNFFSHLPYFSTHLASDYVPYMASTRR